MIQYLVLVADGAHAKLFEKNGTALKQIGETLERSKILDDFDKGAGKPGKITKNAHVFAPHTDLEELQQDQFMRNVANRLHNDYTNVENFILIAPPQTLGLLRKHLNRHILDKVDHEVPKDLTKLKEKDLLEYVQKPYN